MSKTRMFASFAVAAFMVVSFVVPAAAVDVEVGNSTEPWLGWMNVSELPENTGAFLWGSDWGVPDLVSTFDDPSNTLTLSPNTIDDPNEYWYQGGRPGEDPNDPNDNGGPGAPGNKIMEANLYFEEHDTLAGQTVNFSGEVLSNTFTDAHSTIAFIKDFAPDYSSFTMEFVDLFGTGFFSILLSTIDEPGRHVQYGFATTGVNVWATDVEPFGSIEIATVGDPSIPGDFDGDGDVDGDDFLVWQSGFPDTYDGDDFLIWQSNFPYPANGGGSGAVPEPAAGAIALLLALAGIGLRRRR